jgi:26S proteasome regulatory subunit N3
LSKAFKTACLKHDNYGQAMILNLLLRNYLSENLYDQANKLLTKSPKIEFRSNSQLARYFFYKAKILSIQLEYGDAHSCLNQAIRKAPTSYAKGFRSSAYKLFILVKLLLGEIPERTLFTQNGFKKVLYPYFCLTKQVRVGDLAKFRQIVEKYSENFKKDGTYTLVQRYYIILLI